MEVRQTEEFQTWLALMRDKHGRAKILIRLQRLGNGNPGKVREVGGGISEMKINHGPGYRIYYVQRNKIAVVLLCGGDKDSQRRDIVRAKAIASNLEGID